MKILITGANGMLAKAVQTRLKDHQLILTDVEELDITALDRVREFIKQENPDYIINCAAFTAVDKAEEPEVREIVDKVNAEGPKNLAIAAKEADITLVHVSTDYVFSGDLDINKAYKEDDKKGPVTVYGITKLEGEKLIQSNCDKYYIFRTAWLYGDGNNFVKTMINAGKQRDEVTVVADQHGSPTYAVDLADIIGQAIEKSIPYGVYHATNQGFTTWYEFTKEFYKLEDINCKVTPVTSEVYVRPAKRPFNSQLDKSKLLNEGITIPDYLDGLKRYLKG